LKKILLLVMTTVMMLMVLAACGSKPAEPQFDPSAFNGDYICDRADVFIDATDPEAVKINCTWGSSAWENSQWVMTGTLDQETLLVEYHDCVRTDYKYADDGSVETAEEVYTGGHGFIQLIEGDELSLTWQEDQEHMADGMTFVKADLN
jgi:hypothetical protein